MDQELRETIRDFDFKGNLTECIPFGSGHINETYRLTYDTGKHYILQKMNKEIFTKPVELMENIEGVTSWIRRKILEEKIGFLDIYEIIGQAMEQHKRIENPDLEEILSTEQETYQWIESRW